MTVNEHLRRLAKKDIVGGLILRTSIVSPRLSAQASYLRGSWHGELPLRVAKKFVKRGDTVIDMGANWGLYTNLLAGLVGPAGRVHAFEPGDRSSLEAVRAGRSQITIHPCGLSDEAGEHLLHVPVIAGQPTDAMASLSVPSGRVDTSHTTLPVTLARLDDVLPDSGPPVSFIKCDVEGHQLEALRGAERTIRRDRPVLLVEVEPRNQDSPISLTFDYLDTLGYTRHSLFIPGITPTTSQGDYLFVP